MGIYKYSNNKNRSFKNMTYYKNQTNIHFKNDLAIQDTIRAIFSKIHTYLIITNISVQNTAHFYSLKIDPQQIHLIEKTQNLLYTYCYNLTSHEMFLNAEQMNKETAMDFFMKINQIFLDLQNNKAYAYEKK